MLFLISCVFAVIGMFLSFFGITHENFTNHPKYVKILKWIVGAFFVPVLVFAWLENNEADKKNKEQYDTIIKLHTIDSVSQDKINELTAQTTKAEDEAIIAHKNYDDSLKSYHNYTTLLLARYGLKVDTLKNEIRTINGTTEAHINFIREPHNAIKVSMTNNKILAEANIENTGDKVAYNLKTASYLVILSDNDNVSLIDSSVDTYGKDLVGSNTRRLLTVETNDFNQAFEHAKRIFYIIIGEFYSDADLKHIVKFKRANVLSKPDFREAATPGISPDEIIKLLKLGH